MYPPQFRIRNYFLIVLVNTSFLLDGCKSTVSNDQDVIRKLAVDKLGNDIDSYPNQSGECVLYIQKENSVNSANPLKLLVILVRDHTVLYEQSFVPGYAKWITNSSIEVLSVPGMIRENESLDDYKKVINIESHKH